MGVSFLNRISVLQANFTIMRCVYFIRATGFREIGKTFFPHLKTMGNTHMSYILLQEYKNLAVHFQLMQSAS